MAILNNNASNVNDISLLTLTISNPPMQAEVTMVLAKLNELIGALYR